MSVYEEDEDWEDCIEGEMIYKGETKKWFDESLALAYLLKEGVIAPTWGKYSYREDNVVPCVSLFILCNDTFAWGCADGEMFEYKDIERIYRLHKKHPGLAGDIYAIQQRKEKPQKPVELMLKNHNAWYDEFDTFEENYYDKALRELAEKKKSREADKE